MKNAELRKYQKAAAGGFRGMRQDLRRTGILGVDSVCSVLSLSKAFEEMKERAMEPLKEQDHPWEG